MKSKIKISNKLFTIIVLMLTIVIIIIVIAIKTLTNHPKNLELEKKKEILIKLKEKFNFDITNEKLELIIIEVANKSLNLAKKIKKNNWKDCKEFLYSFEQVIKNLLEIYPLSINIKSQEKFQKALVEAIKFINFTFYVINSFIFIKHNDLPFKEICWENLFFDQTVINLNLLNNKFENDWKDCILDLNNHLNLFSEEFSKLKNYSETNSWVRNYSIKNFLTVLALSNLQSLKGKILGDSKDFANKTLCYNNNLQLYLVHESLNLEYF